MNYILPFFLLPSVLFLPFSHFPLPFSVFIIYIFYYIYNFWVWGEGVSVKKEGEGVLNIFSFFL